MISEKLLMAFSKALFEHCCFDYQLFRNDNDEKIAVDNHGHMVNAFDGCLTLRSYNEDILTIPTLTKIGEILFASGSFDELEQLCHYINMSHAERKEKGFPLWGVVWEFEVELFDSSVHIYDTFEIISIDY